MSWTTQNPPTMLIRSFPNMNSLMMTMIRSFPNMNYVMIRSFPSMCFEMIHDDELYFHVEMYRHTSHTEAPHKVKAHSL